jgi:dihydroxyacid dehydratase/phosphogluconate dehydratase
MTPWLALDQPTVSGVTMGQSIADAKVFDRKVIFEAAAPFKPQGGIAVLRGNLAPNGAVIKPSAATPALMQPPRPGRHLRVARTTSRSASTTRTCRSTRTASWC